MKKLATGLFLTFAAVAALPLAAQDRAAGPPPDGGFDRVDTDGDGLISLDEFVDGAHRRGGPGGAHGPEGREGPDSAGAGRGRGAGHGPSPGGECGLARFDADGDGTLSDDERDAMVAARFAELDADGDGFLSSDERPARGHGHGGPPPERLERLDADGDGTVTRDEFLSGVGAHFDELDRNGDGVLSEADRP